jgi:hypothetical protein
MCREYGAEEDIGLHKGEVTRGLRRSHSEEHENAVIIWRRMEWVGHVARIGEREGAYRVGNLSERDRFEDLILDGRIILKWIFKKLVRRKWTSLIWLRIVRSGGLL